MFEEVPISILGTLTPSALLGLCVFFIMTGRLVPVKTHDRELLVRDKQIEYLTHALTTCREAADRRADQVGELMEHSRITTAIIRSLPEVESGEITA